MPSAKIRHCHPNIGGFWEICQGNHGEMNIEKHCFKCQQIDRYLYSDDSSGCSSKSSSGINTPEHSISCSTQIIKLPVKVC